MTELVHQIKTGVVKREPLANEHRIGVLGESFIVGVAKPRLSLGGLAGLMLELRSGGFVESFGFFFPKNMARHLNLKLTTIRDVA